MFKKTGLLIGFSLLTLPLCAHDTWVAPDRFAVRRGDTIELHMTSGMAFPKLDTAIKPERVARALIRAGGRSSMMMPLRRGAHSLDFRIHSRSTGVATIAVDLKPNTIELSPKQVAEYLDEIGADAELRRMWADAPEPKRWRETYTKHAKSFVLVETPDDSWKAPMELAFEFVPLTDPTSLRVGGTLPIRLIESGKPLANFPVGVVHGTDGDATILKTDDEGRVDVPLPKSGRYMLRATHIRPAQRTDADWISDFTTVTLNVRE